MLVVNDRIVLVDIRYRIPDTRYLNRNACPESANPVSNTMKKKPTELAGRKGITTSHPTLKMRWLEREFGGWDDALFGRRWLGRQRLVSSCHQRSGGHEYIQRRVRSIQVKYSRIFKSIQKTVVSSQNACSIYSISSNQGIGVQKQQTQ